MSAFDRFRRLEKPRPERAGPTSRPESVSERFGQPEIPPDPADRAPLGCAKCGGDNPALSARCFNCGADLETAEMRAHQESHRESHLEAQRRALEERERCKREAEAAAERDLERRRRAAIAPPTPTSIPSGEWPANTPIVRLLRGASRIGDPSLRVAALVAICGAFAALVGFGISSADRAWMLVPVALLLGFNSRWRRRGWWW